MRNAFRIVLAALVMAAVLAIGYGLIVSLPACNGGGGGGTAVKVNVCEATGLLPAKCCPKIVEREFQEGQQPKKTCEAHPCVKVRVCETTGLFPNEWCPVIIEKEFKPGEEPGQICGLHRIPKLKAKLVIWAADLLAGGVGDPLAFVDKVAEAVGPPDEQVFIRVFGSSNWKRQWQQPYRVVARWNAGYADVPADKLPFYDLTQDDDIWWGTFRAVLDELKAKGLGIQVVLEDRLAHVGGHEKYYSPWSSNIQDRDPADPGLNRLPDGVWALGENTLEPWHRAYYRRIAAELNSNGVHYLVEVANEYDSIDNPASQMIEWHQRRVNDLISAGVPKERIVGSAIREGPAIAKQVGIYGLHGIGRADQLKADYLSETGLPNARLMISADGFVSGSGRADAKGRKGASAEEAVGLARRALELGFRHIETMDRGLYASNNDVAQFGAWDGGPSKAVALALRGL